MALGKYSLADADNWDVMEGHVQSAAWSPCGRRVIFADSVQPTLYSLTVDPVPPLGEKSAVILKVYQLFFITLKKYYTISIHY